jgi:hypothetical protein
LYLPAAASFLDSAFALPAASAAALALASALAFSLVSVAVAAAAFLRSAVAGEEP